MNTDIQSRINHYKYFCKLQWKIVFPYKRSIKVEYKAHLNLNCLKIIFKITLAANLYIYRLYFVLLPCNKTFTYFCLLYLCQECFIWGSGEGFVFDLSNMHIFLLTLFSKISKPAKLESFAKELSLRQLSGMENFSPNRLDLAEIGTTEA